jgi:glycosyltransferase involved in cell wall biosynthesis
VYPSHIRRICSNIHDLEKTAPAGVSVVCHPARDVPNRALRNLKLLAAALRSDWLVIHFELPDVIFFVLALRLIPWGRCRIATLDFFAGTPRPWTGWFVRRVDRLLVYFRDWSRYERALGIAGSRFQYIPFKVNSIERIRAAEIRDDGYLFCGGRSRRDFRTLFLAVEGLGIPVKIVTSPESELNRDGSTLRGLTPPAGVEIVQNEPSADFFIRTMAASRLVALPLVKGSDTQAGIGVYLQAMAARKCVIVSEGLGVSDVITDQAIVVPAGDPAALREAIRRAWNDADLRREYAGRGYEYAMRLGGEPELRRSILRALAVC